MKSYTAGYVLSKHLAALKRLRIVSNEGKALLDLWESAYANSFPLLTSTQQKIASAAANNWFINTTIALNELMLPGDHNHLICRKYYIRKWIEESIATHQVDHLVFLGAGLDPILFTLSELPKNVSLIDHPDMIGSAKKLYEKFTFKSHSPSSKLNYLGVNLNNIDATNKLFESVFKDASKTLFITEGLIDYLSAESAKNLLSHLNKKILAKDNKWFGTLFCLKEMSIIEYWVFKLAVKSIGESINWVYSKNEFEDTLSPENTSKMHILGHCELYKNASIDIQMNKKIMNGFYLFKC